MIRHIFKIIWNERRTNAWLVLEFILVFTVLWFCNDYLFDMTKRWLQPTGFNTEHTYEIRFYEKDGTNPNLDDDKRKEEKFAATMTIFDRIKKYPGVENVCLSRGAVPFGGGRMGSNYIIDADTVGTQFRVRYVTAAFFDVFKIKPVSGKVFETDFENYAEVIVAGAEKGILKDRPVSEVKTVMNTWEGMGNMGDPKVKGKEPLRVIGITSPLKAAFYEKYEISVFERMKRENICVAWNNVAIRVSPNADSKDFAARFMKDMKSQISVDRYYPVWMIPAQEGFARMRPGQIVSSNLKSIFAVTAFLLINIFLGIIGTFWFLTQARRNEIGLRIALGSSKRKVVGMMVAETLIILFATSIIATIICFNVSLTDFLQKMGLPLIERSKDAPVDYVRHLVNYLLTFGVLTVIAIAAVIYPARQAAKTQPAETLRDE